jgi:hypothetical protein
MAHVAGAGFKATLLLEIEHRLAEIAMHRKLRGAWRTPRKGSDIRHQTPSLEKKAL